MIEITHKVTCDHCEASHTSEFHIAPGGRLPTPSMPDGWEVVNGRLVCDRHEVTVTPKEQAPAAEGAGTP